MIQMPNVMASRSAPWRLSSRAVEDRGDLGGRRRRRDARSLGRRARGLGRLSVVDSGEDSFEPRGLGAEAIEAGGYLRGDLSDHVGSGWP
jgi:hypothetical protein